MDKCPAPPQNTPSTPIENTSKTQQQSKHDESAKLAKDSKTPKRASVTTLFAFANKSSEKKPAVTKVSQVKPAKRVTVTTLTTFDCNDEAKANQLLQSDDEILKSPVEVKSPLPEASVAAPSPQHQQPTTPRSAKRSLASPKGSPSNKKPPKRVQVTTLTTFDSNMLGKERSKGTFYFSYQNF